MLDFSGTPLNFELNFLSQELTEGEIQLIEDLISWRRDPNNFEISGRGVKFEKKKSLFTTPNPFYSMIKINGIGYQKVRDLGGGFLEKKGDFLKPSIDNILNVKQNLSAFTTTFPKGNTIVKSYGEFEFSGSYLESDLNVMLKNYQLLTGFKSKNLSILKLYAYGHYTDENMVKGEERASFLISAEPKEKRFLQYIKDNISIFNQPKELIKLLFPLIKGLRELHDYGFAHLQPHFDNFYIINKKCYLVDLETLFRNNGNKIEFLIARTLDLVTIITNYAKILKQLGISNKEFKMKMEIFQSSLLTIYLNFEITPDDINQNKHRVLEIPQIFKVDRKNGMISDIENLFMLLYFKLNS